MNLSTPLKDAGRLYKMYASRLENLEIKKIEDFLTHVPFRYDDYSRIAPINTLRVGDIVTIQGTIIDLKNELTKSNKKMQKVIVSDATGEIEITWFNQPFLTKTLKKGTLLSLSGRVEWFGRNKTILSPEYEILDSLPGKTIHTGRLVPIYPETKGVSSKWLRRQVYNILKNYKAALSEYIPQETLSKHKLIEYYDALQKIHFPQHATDVVKARERLAFDELLLLQLAGMIRRSEWQKEYVGSAFAIEKYRRNIENFWNSLPFSLTNAQIKALDDIFKDLASSTPMNRLVQGDVGSGKTVVAAIAMYVAYLNGFQSVLMAPTEILALQHFATIDQLLSPIGVHIGLATGSKKSFQSSDMLIGTHAVLSENIQFDKLGLIVIDEQQRFGVEQRAILRAKGKNPHVLTMTATPIPRTVALTMYGDLSLSFLDEMPKGRLPIKTWLVPKIKRDNAYEWIRKQVRQEKSQIFIICPFIEESESMSTIKAALGEYQHLAKDVFPELKLGLLHGKLKPKEKDQVLGEFKDRKFDILVATPVVEVGIDIPNATVIMIEGSERFGLAGLHQLRGRVGRGDKQSYCLLFTESTKPETIDKLKSLEHIANGAQLAELDLKLRGPGDVYGTMQSGIPNLKIANFSDTPLIMKAKQDAEIIFPSIQNYPALIEKIHTITTKQVTPD